NASRSPGRRGSSARPCSSGCCGRSPTPRWCSSFGPAGAARSTSGPGARSSTTTRSTGSEPPSAAGLDALVAERVSIVAGDVGRDGLGLDDAGRELLAGCDIVIHSAATVAFDSPLDNAVEVNLLGPARIARTLQSLGVSPHLVAVSTCYVAGNRRGAAPEQMLADSPFFLDVDWRAEVDAARRARADAEADSRSPEALRRFRAEARRELGAAGVPLLAAKTEQRRAQWVKDRMI